MFSYIHVTYNFNKIDKNFKYPLQAHGAFFGDSHIETAVIDSMLDGVLNNAKISESSYFSYYKLKYILSRKNNLKKIYLGIGYHSISSYFDEYTFGNQSKYVGPKYFMLLPFDQRVKNVLCNFFSIPTYYKSIITSSISNSSKNVKELDFIGGYYNRFNNLKADSSQIEARIRAQFYNENKTIKDFSIINITYLVKIKELCDSNDIELYIVNSPIHPYYKSLIPSKYVQKYQALMVENELNVLDYTGFMLDDSDYTPDGDHITLSGAKKWTIKLDHDLP
jgi:hypothetical protein